MNIVREDKTEIYIETHEAKSKYCVFVFAGFGYSLDHPLLYYCRSIAKQLGVDYIGIDPKYLFNEGFLGLSNEEQDAYFENDIRKILGYVTGKAAKYERQIYIGKSMGTTIMNRIIENHAYEGKSGFIMLTPGIEWERTIDNLANVSNRCLIVGSKGDGKYIVPKLEKAKSLGNLIFKEYEDLNHGLESGDAIKDIQVLAEVMRGILEFIKVESRGI